MMNLKKTNNKTDATCKDCFWCGAVPDLPYTGGELFCLVHGIKILDITDVCEKFKKAASFERSLSSYA